MQLEIDCYEWMLGKIEVNKMPFDRLERIIKATIKDLEKRKDKTMVRTEKWKNGCNLRYSSIFLEDMESSAEKPK
jgi:hypothetical protein